MLIVLDVAIVVKEFSNRCACVVSVGTGLLVARVEVWLVVLVEALDVDQRAFLGYNALPGEDDWSRGRRTGTHTYVCGANKGCAFARAAPGNNR